MTISGHMLRMAAAARSGIVLPDFGAPFEGGFFAGVYQQDGGLYALVVADKSAETYLRWRTSNTDSPGSASVIDGLANSIATNDSLHPAAKYCRDYRGGEFDDWFLPALNQLEIAYFTLKPTTESNNTAGGINLNAVPARTSNYSLIVPGQTLATAFKSGGAQAFASDQPYWSSTQATTMRAHAINFANGAQITNINKNIALAVRPFRSVRIN